MSSEIPYTRALDRFSLRDEILWLAGLIEGEGSFGISKSKGAKGSAPIIQLTMTDRDVVERAQRIFGPTIKVRQRPPAREGWKTQFYIYVIAVQAIGWMMMLYPFLHQRRQARIREVLEIWRRQRVAFKYRSHCPRGHSTPLAMKPGRENWRRECRICNRERAAAWRRRRGVPPLEQYKVSRRRALIDARQLRLGGF